MSPILSKAVLTVLLASHIFVGYAQIIEWNISILNDQAYNPSSITLDNNNQIYLSGTFLDSVVLNFTQNPILLRSKSLNDSYLIRIDDEGQIKWTIHLSGYGEQIIHKILVTPNNELMVFGSHSGTTYFEKDNVESILATDTLALFAAVYTLDGNFIKASQLNYDGSFDLIDLALYRDESLYLLGTSSNTTKFIDYYRQKEYKCKNISTAGTLPADPDFEPDQDIYVIKSDQDFNIQWVKVIGSDRDEICTSIDVDREGKIYIGGAFNYEMDFDPSESNKILNPMGLYYDPFLLKWNNNGDFVWVLHAEAQGDDFFGPIDISLTDAIIFSISHRGPMIIHAANGDYSIDGNGEQRNEIVRMDTKKNIAWHLPLCSGAKTTINDIKIFGELSFTLTGLFQGTCDFDPTETIYKLTEFGGQSRGGDVIISSYDLNGNHGNSWLLGGKSIDSGLMFETVFPRTEYILGTNIFNESPGQAQTKNLLKVNYSIYQTAPFNYKNTIQIYSSNKGKKYLFELSKPATFTVEVVKKSSESKLISKKDKNYIEFKHNFLKKADKLIFKSNEEVASFNINFYNK